MPRIGASLDESTVSDTSATNLPLQTPKKGKKKGKKKVKKVSKKTDPNVQPLPPGEGSTILEPIDEVLKSEQEAS